MIIAGDFSFSKLAYNNFGDLHLLESLVVDWKQMGGGS